jgi:ABC-2 type transport system ATP-binding protein
MDAIVMEGLTKAFGSLVAVEGVSLTIPEGELFGLLGPNGAGKTTLLSMLSTLLPPTGGEARVWGHSIREDPEGVRRSIGIVFQDPSLDIQLTGRENLDFHGRLYGLDRTQREARIREVLELVELTEKADLQVKTYSGGMRRRLELARGLMHFPKVLLLDEPTLGLDPQTRRRIWEYIEGLNREERITIILTTHYMEEADHLCRRVAIIDQGRIITLDTPRRLKDGVGEDILSVQTRNPVGLKRLLEGRDWVREIASEDGTLHLGVREGEGLIPRIIDLARGEGIEVLSIGLRKPTLEDVFLHYTGRKIREEQGSIQERMRSYLRGRERR